MRRPVPPRGRLAIVTDAGRDAVDADGARRRRAPSRTANTCGPDASAAASSWRKSASDGVKNLIAGERTEQAVNHCAGNAGSFRCDRGDYACVLFYFARKAAGALSARYSLRPLISEGGTSTAKLGRIAPRECGAASFRHCERSEAIQLSSRK